MTGCEDKGDETALKEAARKLPLTSEVDMRIARDGSWYHDGGLISRKPLVRLFSTVLNRDDNGVYWLITPVEKAKIVVEDVPFIITEMKNDGVGTNQSISFRNNVGTWFDLDREHPIRIEIKSENNETCPYVLVRKGLEARILRSVYYQLIELAVEQGTELGIWSKGQFYVLGNLE